MTVLRPATDADRDLLLAVYASTRAEELARVAWSEREKATFVRSQFEAQDAHYRAHYAGAEFLVIECDGVGVGRFYVHRGPSETRVMDIALLPAFRGHGIGGALLRELLDEGRPVSIHVEMFNAGARRLYEHLGFEAVDEGGVYTLMRAPGTGSGEDDLVAHAASVGTERDDEQIELAEVRMREGEHPLGGRPVGGPVEDQREGIARGAGGGGAGGGGLGEGDRLSGEGERLAHSGCEVVQGELVEHGAATLAGAGLTRRSLLAFGAAAGVAAASAQPASAARVVRRLRRPGQWRRSTYEARIDERWRVRRPVEAQLQLVEVRDLQGTARGGAPLARRQDAYELVFEQRSGPVLGEGRIGIRHPELAFMWLFVVPGKPGARPRFSAIVNRARS